LNGVKINIKNILKIQKHILSHQIIYARVIQVETSGLNNFPENFIQVNKKDISKFAVSRLMEQFITELNIG